MRFEVMLHFIKKKMRLFNVNIHTNFNRNRFINECARKKKAKILESHGFRVFFLSRCRKNLRSLINRKKKYL